MLCVIQAVAMVAEAPTIEPRTADMALIKAESMIYRNRWEQNYDDLSTMSFIIFKCSGSNIPMPLPWMNHKPIPLSWQ